MEEPTSTAEESATESITSAAELHAVPSEETAAKQSPTHSIHRRVVDLLQRLAPGKMRIGFFLGAGCPLSVRVGDEGKSKPLIPDIEGLTNLVKAFLISKKELKDVSNAAWDRVVARGIESPTIEDVLSHIRALYALCGNGSIDGFSKVSLKELDQIICEKVREIVSVSLPSSDTPYHALASWIQAISREKPVEVFTTNYDILLEQALEDQGVPYFDGFVGATSAFLDLESMAEDDLPARWARLWKIHGSINWWMNSKNKIRRTSDKVTGEQLLIYPSHLKYDQSRQMPYYAMLDRLRVFLRSDQSVLITCGYSFADEHINAYISQGLAGNPNASCLSMIYGDRSNVYKAVQLAKRHANLSVLAADGGVIGTLDRTWDSVKSESNPAYSIAIATDGVPAYRTKAQEDQSKWLLGDFSTLGQFLAYQLSSRNVERGAPEDV